MRSRRFLSGRPGGRDLGCVRNWPVSTSNGFLALPFRMADSTDLIRAAFPLAQQYEIALYDALYLALAQRLSLPFLLAERKLFERIGQLPLVQRLADYAARPG